MNIITIIKKIKIHYLVYVALAIAIVLGLIKEFLLVFATLLIHELGHLFFLLLFKKRIIKITFYPFGGVMEYLDRPDYTHKNLLISSGGIIVNFFLSFLFFLIGNKFLTELNLLFALINLIPIHPFDGSKILASIIYYFLPYRICKILISILSFSVAVLIFIYLFNYYEALFLLFLLVTIVQLNLKSILNLKKDYQSFIFNKYLYPNKKLPIKQTLFWTNNPIMMLFYGKNMIFDYDGLLLTEESLLIDYYKKDEKL